MRPMASVLVIVPLLAGCSTPPGGPGPAAVDLGIAESWDLQSAVFQALPCSPDAQPSGLAEPVAPYDGSLADFVRATAGVLGADLANVTYGNESLRAGDVEYVLVRYPDYDGRGAPPRIEVTIEGRAWPASDADRDAEAGALMTATAPQEAGFTWNRNDHVTSSGVIFPPGIDPTGSVSFHAYYGSQETEIFVFPWYHLGASDAKEEATRPSVEAYIECAHPGAVQDEATQWGVQYGSPVVEHLVRVPRDGHHCGGPAWWISVDAVTLDVLSDRPVLCD